MVGIPQDDQEALQFITEKIDTVPHLEAVLLLWSTRPNVWTVDDVAKRIYVPLEAARLLLGELAGRGIITAASGELNRYLCDPNPELNELITHVDALYRRNVVAVSRMIHEKPSAALRQFSDAFRFTKKDGK